MGASTTRRTHARKMERVNLGTRCVRVRSGGLVGRTAQKTECLEGSRSSPARMSSSRIWGRRDKRLSSGGSVSNLEIEDSAGVSLDNRNPEASLHTYQARILTITWGTYTKAFSLSLSILILFSFSTYLCTTSSTWRSRCTRNTKKHRDGKSPTESGVGHVSEVKRSDWNRRAKLV